MFHFLLLFFKERRTESQEDKMGDVKSEAHMFEVYEKRNGRVEIRSEQHMMSEKLNEKKFESEKGKKDQT